MPKNKSEEKEEIQRGENGYIREKCLKTKNPSEITLEGKLEGKPNGLTHDCQNVLGWNRRG